MGLVLVVDLLVVSSPQAAASGRRERRVRRRAVAASLGKAWAQCTEGECSQLTGPE